MEMNAFLLYFYGVFTWKTIKITYKPKNATIIWKAGSLVVLMPIFKTIKSADLTRQSADLTRQGADLTKCGADLAKCRFNQVPIYLEFTVHVCLMAHYRSPDFFKMKNDIS